MMQLTRFVPLLSGLLFGSGLVLGGMTNPEKVKGFLRLDANWDPSLAFVTAGGLLVMALGHWWMARQRKGTDTSLHGSYSLRPSRAPIDLALVAGAAIFGIGWGLGGYCPGPTVVSAAAGRVEALTVLGAILAGMLLRSALQRAFERARNRTLEDA